MKFHTLYLSFKTDYLLPKCVCFNVLAVFCSIFIGNKRT